MQNITNDDRVELSMHIGIGEYADRVAKTYRVKDNYYEVEFILNQKIIETKIMKSESGDAIYFHSESYADSAAENYVLGYM